MIIPIKSTSAEQLLSGVTAEFDHLRHLTWMEAATNVGLSVGTLGLGLLLLWLADKLTCLVMRIIPGLSQAERKIQAAGAMRLTKFVLSAAIAIATLFLIAEIWDFDPLGWTRTTWGAEVSGAASKLIVIIVIASVVFEAATVLQQYFLSRLLARASGEPRRVAQLHTLGPIFRSGIQIAVILIALVTLLGQIGVQIAPVLTGAGVVGIAVGFGAQTLVKDFFTGFFLLIEDIVAIEDVVQIQGFSGTVEEMTLRTIRLRDFDGTLHIFPYGEAQIIHNMTKTFSFSAFDIPVKLDTDLDKAMTVMRQSFEDLRSDSKCAKLIIGDIEVVGVDLLSDTGIILKGRIRTQPQERWRVLREYNRLLKINFDKAGIVLTHK